MYFPYIFLIHTRILIVNSKPRTNRKYASSKLYLSVKHSQLHLSVKHSQLHLSVKHSQLHLSVKHSQLHLSVKHSQLHLSVKHSFHCANFHKISSAKWTCVAMFDTEFNLHGSVNMESRTDRQPLSPLQ
jgi:hypothetical protein